MAPKLMNRGAKRTCTVEEPSLVLVRTEREDPFVMVWRSGAHDVLRSSGAQHSSKHYSHRMAGSLPSSPEWTLASHMTLQFAVQHRSASCVAPGVRRVCISEN